MGQSWKQSTKDPKQVFSLLQASNLEILKETYEEECSKLNDIKTQYLKEKTEGSGKFCN